MKSTQQVNWREAAGEAARHLSNLVRVNTANPPGGETAGARYLAEVLAREDYHPQVVESAPGRGSVVARLPGRTGQAERPGPLLLLSHLDVVPATAADWTRDPFGGEIVDGEVWGRGAQDCKGVGVTWLELMLLARRLGVAPRRDIIFAATADEEAGGVFGVKWLVENHWDLIAADYCLNEGGGNGMAVHGQTYYPYQTAEKAVCWLKLTATGPAGHASRPRDDNAVVLLAEAVAALGRAELPVRVGATVRNYLLGLAAAQKPEVAGALRRIASLAEGGGPGVRENPGRRAGEGPGPRAGEPPRNGLPTDAEVFSLLGGAIDDKEDFHMIKAMLHNGASPTILRAGEKTNVIPSSAEAAVDCRILPGQTPESLMEEVNAVLRQALGKRMAALRVETPRTALATESDPDTPLAEALRRALAAHAPGARLVPYMATGATDARYLRPKGVVVYGFAPTLPEVDGRGVHGVNERLPIASLEFALRMMWDVVTNF